METKEIIELIKSRIVKDEDVIAETPEYKFARGLVNSRLEQIIKEINNK